MEYYGRTNVILSIIELGEAISAENISIKMELSSMDQKLGRKKFRHVGIVVGTSAPPGEDTTVSPGALL
jgi:hypothetical protein